MMVPINLLPAAPPDSQRVRRDFVRGLLSSVLVSAALAWLVSVGLQGLQGQPLQPPPSPPSGPGGIDAGSLQSGIDRLQQQLAHQQRIDSHRRRVADLMAEWPERAPPGIALTGLTVDPAGLSISGLAHGAAPVAALISRLRQMDPPLHDAALVQLQAVDAARPQAASAPTLPGEQPDVRQPVAPRTQLLAFTLTAQWAAGHATREAAQ